MKDLAKEIRNGSVAKFNSSQLGKSEQGKGSYPRFNYQSSETYKKNYDRIFKKNKTNM